MDHLHQETNVNLGPTCGEFAPGVQLEGHLRLGGEYDKEVANMSEASRTAAVCFGLRLTLSNPDVGAQAVETLNQLKEMAMGVDQVKEAMDKGVDVTFRHEGTSVWVNVTVPESMPELQMVEGWKDVNLASTVFSGKNDFKVTSGVDPCMLLSTTVDDVVGRLSNFSVVGEGNFEEMHHVMTAVQKLVTARFPNNSELMMMMAGVNVLTAFRSFKWDFKYDASVVKTVVLAVMEASGKLPKRQEQLAGVQEMGNGFLPQAQMMAPMFIGPYSELLKSVNLGHYEVFVMVPRLRVHVTTGMTLFGLNAYLNELFLSQ
jgi:hypothetical protein